MAAILAPTRRREVILLASVAVSFFIWFNFWRLASPVVHIAPPTRIDPTFHGHILADIDRDRYADDEQEANSTLGVKISST